MIQSSDVRSAKNRFGQLRGNISYEKKVWEIKNPSEMFCRQYQSAGTTIIPLLKEQDLFCGGTSSRIEPNMVHHSEIQMVSTETLSMLIAVLEKGRHTFGQ